MFSFGGQIRKPVTAEQAPPWPTYPTSATGYTLTFTAKRRRSDTTPLVQRTGTVQNGGAWVVNVLGGDTSAFTRTENLSYDVVLTATGEATVVSEGSWLVEKSVGL